MRAYRRLCSFLDAVYTAGGVLAALFLIAILLLIVLQMVARWTGQVFSGAPDYAGYCMASASFLAFAHALNRGAHIRVSILLNALGRGRYWLEIWCFTAGALASSYLAWYAIRATRWSYKFHDISQGQDATPLWIPQLGMSIGATLLALCFWDNVVRLIVLKQHAIRVDAVAMH
ncbi:MAG: TRAP transporter small permease [Granulosicoccus sp.]|nr:TRAP transporter small permease [Granulosicoccus sp.]